MCGRITQQLTSDEIAQLFGAEVSFEDPGGHYNVAPTQTIRGIVERSERRIVTSYRWGLIPGWADSPKIGAQMINARAETVADKPSFRTALRRSRCLIPADAFYEWRREGTSKTPYAIVRRDGGLLAFAGLWAAWRDRETGTKIESCTIITTVANAMMSTIHDRMPVILPADAYDEWLDPGNEAVDHLRHWLVPCADEELVAYPVSRLVNDVRHDGPELIVPLASIA